MAREVVEWTCSGCQALVGVDFSNVGQTILCPFCNTPKVVPPPPTPGTVPCPKCGGEAVKGPWGQGVSSAYGASQATKNLRGGHPVLGALALGAMAAKALLSTPRRCTKCGHQWRTW